MTEHAHLSRRDFVRRAVVVSAAAAFPGVLAACSKNAAPTRAPSALDALIDQRVRGGAKKDLSVFLGGEDYIEGIANYVAFGLAPALAQPISGAAAKVWIAAGAGGEGDPIGPVDAPWGPYTKPDAPAPAPQGVNAAELTFERAGIWQMLVAVETQTGLLVGTSAIQVKPKAGASTLVPGQSAIPSRTPTVDNARGVDPICTRSPRCPFHHMTLAQAIAAGKPTVFMVATPKYCMSRTCGPNLEELITVSRQTDARSNFVHAEVHRSDKPEDIQRQALSPTFREWRLQSEPWLFLIDADGKVAERFEGPIVASSIRSALEPLL